MDPNWTQAVAAWNEAHGVVCLHGAAPGGVPDPVMDAATSIESDALDGLLTLPAPDRAAVGTKINALLDYQDGNEIDRQALRRIAADASRPGGADIDRGPWDAAFAAWQQAREEWTVSLDRFNIAERAYFEAITPATSAAYDRLDAEQTRLSSIDQAAMLALNAIAAPDLSAAIIKLEMANDYALPMLPVIADLRRFTWEGC